MLLIYKIIKILTFFYNYINLVFKINKDWKNTKNIT